MTAASTAIGVGMMPLNLWIYSRSWTNDRASIPYLNIVIALNLIIVPVAIGMLILMKYPKAAKWIAKVRYQIKSRGVNWSYLIILKSQICDDSMRCFHSLYNWSIHNITSFNPCWYPFHVMYTIQFSRPSCLRVC